MEGTGDHPRRRILLESMERGEINPVVHFRPFLHEFMEELTFSTEHDQQSPSMLAGWDVLRESLEFLSADTSSSRAEGLRYVVAKEEYLVDTITNQLVAANFQTDSRIWTKAAECMVTIVSSMGDMVWRYAQTRAADFAEDVLDVAHVLAETAVTGQDTVCSALIHVCDLLAALTGHEEILSGGDSGSSSSSSSHGHSGGTSRVSVGRILLDKLDSLLRVGAKADTSKAYRKALASGVSRALASSTETVMEPIRLCTKPPVVPVNVALIRLLCGSRVIDKYPGISSTLMRCHAALSTVIQSVYMEGCGHAVLCSINEAHDIVASFVQQHNKKITRPDDVEGQDGRNSNKARERSMRVIMANAVPMLLLPNSTHLVSVTRAFIISRVVESKGEGIRHGQELTPEVLIPLLDTQTTLLYVMKSLTDMMENMSDIPHVSQGSAAFPVAFVREVDKFIDVVGKALDEHTISIPARESDAVEKFSKAKGVWYGWKQRLNEQEPRGDVLSLANNMSTAPTKTQVRKRDRGNEISCDSTFPTHTPGSGGDNPDTCVSVPRKKAIKGPEAKPGTGVRSHRFMATASAPAKETRGRAQGQSTLASIERRMHQSGSQTPAESLDGNMNANARGYNTFAHMEDWADRDYETTEASSGFGNIASELRGVVHWGGSVEDSDDDDDEREIVPYGKTASDTTAPKNVMGLTELMAKARQGSKSTNGEKPNSTASGARADNMMPTGDAQAGKLVLPVNHRSSTRNGTDDVSIEEQLHRLYSKLLRSDVCALNGEEETSRDKLPTEIPWRFYNEHQYKRTFEPLVMREVKAALSGVLRGMRPDTRDGIFTQISLKLHCVTNFQAHADSNSANAPSVNRPTAPKAPCILSPSQHTPTDRKLALEEATVSCTKGGTVLKVN